MGDLAAPLVDDARPLAHDSTASLDAKPTPTRWTLGGSIQRACGRVRDLGTMDGAVLLAFVASIGNMLQGWDNASIAGAMFYIKEEFNLHSMPMVEGCIMAMALFGATIITTLSGLLSDRFGRWMMLLTSAIFSLVSALLVIFWSQHVYMLLFARLIQGFSIGLAVTLVPLYIVETAPCGMRGKLSTFPQLSGSAGMFLSYCMVFWMSMLPNVSWRFMLGIQLIPSVIYCILIIFYLPETPSWLVSQGRVDEAKKVMQRLRKMEDVSGEMISLLEATRVGDQTPSIEEYLISTKENSANEKLESNEETVKLYGLPEELHCIAYPLKRQNTDSIGRGASFFDQIVSVTTSFHGSILEEARNIFDEVEEHGPVERDEENQEYPNVEELESLRDDMDDSEYDQLIESKPTQINDLLSRRKSCHIGGGWQLAWKMPSENCLGMHMEGDMERVYLHEGGVPSCEDDSLIDVPASGNLIRATALVNKSVFHKDQTGNHNIDLRSSEKDLNGTKWKDLLEPGVKRALVLGIGIQILQQFAGINGILYYTPQILEQAGVGVLLSKIGINPSSVSILMSAFTTLLMIPFICIAMWLMDRTGRRWLLIATIPILVVSLIVLVTVNIVNLSAELHALLSTISVGMYFCIFVMGFGPIPNIFCSEIFPNKVRAICLALCSLTFWVCDIIVTYTLPVLLRYIGLAGVFGVYAIVCALAFLFVVFKMPETKGVPIEVMAEIFAADTSHPSQQKEVLSPQKDMGENDNSYC